MTENTSSRSRIQFNKLSQDNPNTDNDILFDIIKCNIRHLSMQYVGEKKA